jgi:hypothetical protein
MNILDNASLIVTPNGSKTSKLYSIVPSDGSGDMTFARTGDTATRVNSSGLVETVLANKPRLDYTDSTCAKLLLEPQRTNVVTYSDQFDNAAWTKVRASILSNQIASPDGTSNADKLTNNNTNNDEFIEKASLSITAGTYTASIFVKNSDAITSTIRIVHLTEGTSTSELIYTWATNSFTITGSNKVSGKVTSYGNGWVRLEFTYTIGTVSSHTFRFYGQGLTQVAKFVYIYGAQLEAGAYATSYIPTTTASVTRNADQCYKATATALIGQTEGTMFIDVNIINKISPSTYWHMFLIGSTTDRIVIYMDNNNLMVGLVYASVSIASINAGNKSGKCKIALAYKANDLILYVNGVQAGTATPANIPATSNIDLGGNYIYANFLAGNGYNSAALWKTRLTNQELVTLTSL